MAKPIILSLVYDRGTILASKRAPYDDLIADGLDEKLLAERLQKQHKLICAAVRAGRLEDLKKMTQRDSAARSKTAVGTVEPAATPVFPAQSKAELPYAVFDLDNPIPRPEVLDAAAITEASEPLVEEVEIFGGEPDSDVPEVPAEIIADPANFRPAAGSALSIELLGGETFKGGDRRTVGFMVCRGNGRKVVGNAQIMVKILGTSFRPLIFHAKTDDNGIARINVHLPSFDAGRAAFVARAISDGEETELRRAVARG